MQWTLSLGGEEPDERRAEVQPQADRNSLSRREAVPQPPQRRHDRLGGEWFYGRRGGERPIGHRRQTCDAAEEQAQQRRGYLYMLL